MEIRTHKILYFLGCPQAGLTVIEQEIRHLERRMR